MERGLRRGARPSDAAGGLPCRLRRRPGHRHHDQGHTAGSDETETEATRRMDAKSGTTAGDAKDRVTVPDDETDRHDDTHDGGDGCCASWLVRQVSGSDLGYEDDLLAAHTWRR